MHGYAFLVRNVPFLLSIPFSKHLAILPYRWSSPTLASDCLATADSELAGTHVGPSSSQLDLPDFNDVEAKMALLSSPKLSRETRGEFSIFDNVWSTLILLSLTALSFSM